MKGNNQVTSTESVTYGAEAPTTPFQDAALKAKAEYTGKADAINNNVKLSAEGEQEAMNELREETRTRVATARCVAEAHRATHCRPHCETVGPQPQ